MENRRRGAAGRHAHTLIRVGAVGGLTDAQLLEKYATHGGEVAELAFAVVVERHSPMILRTLRSALRDPNDVDDAFQATFLVLLRRAGELEVEGSIGPWLHGVACRVASAVRSTRARRRLLDQRTAEPNLLPGHAQESNDLGQLVHQEIGRLPEKYRDPIVLCDLEGLSYEHAAIQLGCPLGTIKSRLARGRDRLRDRLTRRGVAPSTGMLLLGPSAGIPDGLLERAIGSASGALLGVPASTPGAARAAALASGVLRGMFLARLVPVATLLLAVGALAGGATLLSQPGDATPRAPTPRPASLGPEATAGDLARIHRALREYRLRHGHYPPAEARDRDGRPLLSWRIAILPYLAPANDPVTRAAYEALARRFRADEPWDGPHNRALLAEMPAPFGPSDPAAPGQTRYQAFVGPGAVFEADRGLALEDVRDDPAATLLVVEAGAPVPWTRPVDLPFAPAAPLPPLGSGDDGRFAAVFVDGHVALVGREAGDRALRALITRDGGEPDDPALARSMTDVTPPPPPPEPGLRLEYNRARDLGEAVQILHRQLADDGKPQFIPLLPEAKIRDAIRAALRDQPTRKDRLTPAGPSTANIDPDIGRVYRRIAEDGAWSQDFWFSVYYTLRAPGEPNGLEGCWVRLSIHRPGYYPKGYALPILDVVYGSANPHRRPDALGDR